MTAKAKGSEKGIMIPELEEAMNGYAPRIRYWSEREIAIVVKYFGKVPTREIVKHLDNRTLHAIEHKATELGLRQKLKESE